MTAPIDQKITASVLDNNQEINLPRSIAHEVDHEGELRIRKTIKDAAPQNAALLSEISGTEDAVSALPNLEHNLIVANEELAAQNSAVDQAALHSGVYRLRYDQKRGKIVVKWFYILTRKRDEFNQKVEDAQKALESTVQEQARAEMRQKELQHDVEQIKGEHAAVLARAEQHGRAHAELDELYHSIFDGPTPGFPDEDDLEARYNSKRSVYRAATKRLKGIRKALKEGTMIDEDLRKVTFELTHALEECDAFFFLHQYCILFFKRAVHVMEHALRLAREMANSRSGLEDRNIDFEHDTLLEALKAIYRPLKDAVGKESSLEREDIQQAAETALGELRRAEDATTRLLDIFKHYDSKDTNALGTTSRQYEDARQTLHGIRQHAFEVTAGFGASAPAYHECCDRAEGFTNDSLAECALIEVSPFDEAGMPPPPSYDRATNPER